MNDLYWSFIQQKQITTNILESIDFINKILFTLVITFLLTPFSFIIGYIVGIYFIS